MGPLYLVVLCGNAGLCALAVQSGLIGWAGMEPTWAFAAGALLGGGGSGVSLLGAMGGLRHSGGAAGGRRPVDEPLGLAVVVALCVLVGAAGIAAGEAVRVVGGGVIEVEAAVLVALASAVATLGLCAGIGLLLAAGCRRYG